MPEVPANNTKTSRQHKRRRWLLRSGALLFGLLLAFAAAEVAVRVLGETDADGNFFWKEKPVGDIHPQVAWVREKIDEYKANPYSRMIADRHTGWSPRRGVVTHNGMYRYDSHGIRCDASMKGYTLQPAPGVTRIAIYGDSFAHSDDVPIEKSWGRHLQDALNAEGGKRKTEGGKRTTRGGSRPPLTTRHSPLTTHHSFEVVNFGVSAYGMDQAFLRWRYLGKQFSPRIVLFGFQAENVNRNVNLLRGFYVMHTGIPFSKPRFILDGSGRLKAINEPTLPVDSVPDVMAGMDDWKYAKYEWFYNPADYRRRWWNGSRFVSLLVDWWTHAEEPGISRAEPVFRPDSEPQRVTLQLLREFRDEVQAQGGRFVVVHLPKKSDLQRLRSGRGLVYELMWTQIEREHATVDPLPALLKSAEGESLDVLFAAPKHAHYSDRGNRIIADVIRSHGLAKSPSPGEGP